MTKIEKNRAPNAKAPPPRPGPEQLSREERREELGRKLARLNRETLMQVEALQQKPKKSDH